MNPGLDVENQVCALAIYQKADFLIGEQAQKIEPRHFASDFHRRVFDTVCEMIDRGDEVSPRRVKRAMAVSDSNLGLWREITTSPASLAHGEHYARQIRLEWLRREVYRLCQRKAEEIIEHDKPAEFATQLVDEITQAVFDSEGSGDDSFRSGKQGALELLSYLEEINSQEGQGMGIAPGIPGLDKVVRFQPGSLNVIAARPSQGKSALAMQMIMRIGDAHKVALFSLEMTFREIGMRYLVSETSITSTQVMEGQRLSHRQQSEASTALGMMGQKAIFVRDAPFLDSKRLNFLLRGLARQGVQVVVIDYLSLITTPRKTDRRIELGDITRMLKRLAKEFEMAVVLLAQLNRDAEGKSEDLSLSNLAETDDISRDASVVIMIGADENLYVKKNRNGPTGRVVTAFDAPNQTFRVFANEDEKNDFLSIHS